MKKVNLENLPKIIQVLDQNALILKVIEKHPQLAHDDSRRLPQTTISRSGGNIGTYEGWSYDSGFQKILQDPVQFVADWKKYFPPPSSMHKGISFDKWVPLVSDVIQFIPNLAAWLQTPHVFVIQKKSVLDNVVLGEIASIPFSAFIIKTPAVTVKSRSFLPTPQDTMLVRKVERDLWCCQVLPSNKALDQAMMKSSEIRVLRRYLQGEKDRNLDKVIDKVTSESRDVAQVIFYVNSRGILVFPQDPKRIIDSMDSGQQLMMERAAEYWRSTLQAFAGVSNDTIR